MELEHLYFEQKEIYRTIVNSSKYFPKIDKGFARYNSKSCSFYGGLHYGPEQEKTQNKLPFNHLLSSEGVSEQASE